MQQVLIIGKVWPEPGSSAAGSRTMQLIGELQSQGMQIAFACAAGESEFVADLKTFKIAQYKVEINSSSFDDLLKTLNPDIVIFDRFTTEEQFGWRVAQHCPEAIRILDTIDLHCLRNARHLAIKERRTFHVKDLLISESAKREIASIYRCDLSLMVSVVEMDLLQNLFKVPAELLLYLPLYYPTLQHSQIENWPGFEQREQFISIGNFLHEPNWDAVLYLKNNIWPLIRQKLPKAQLHIYGAYATQKVFQLNNPKEGFIIKGRAESAENVMLKARVNLAPLRFGAGIKGKLLDSMLYGTPNITTPIGTESMQFDLPWNGIIANTAEELAEAACELYTNQGLWKQAQQNGIELINTVFPRQLHGPKFTASLKNLRTSLKSHRVENFTGNMLMQQSLAATKYMALWIEEKNKKP